MLPITERSTSRLFASAKIFRFRGRCSPCLRDEFGSSMASVAERLLFGEATSTPVVGVALLYIVRNWASFGANNLRQDSSTPPRRRTHNEQRARRSRAVRGRTLAAFSTSTTSFGPEQQENISGNGKFEGQKRNKNLLRDLCFVRATCQPSRVTHIQWPGRRPFRD